MSRSLDVYIKTDENIEQFRDSLSAILGVEAQPSISMGKSLLGYFLDKGNSFSFDIFFNKTRDDTDSEFYGYPWSLWIFPFSQDENDDRDYETLQTEAGRYVFNELKKTERYSLLLVVDSALVVDRFDLPNESKLKDTPE